MYKIYKHRTTTDGRVFYIGNRKTTAGFIFRYK